jgi:hypothetical protein
MANAKRAKKWRCAPDPPSVSDVVSFSIRRPCSDAEIIRKIAEELNLQVGPLPPELEEINRTRPRPVFGSASEYLNQIVVCVPNLHWQNEDGVLKFEFSPIKSIGGHKGIAGRLMVEAKRSPTNRLSEEQWLSIGRALDERTLDPLDCLEPAQRKVVKDYNKSGVNVHVHTFETALTRTGRKGQKVRRAVKQWLNRACAACQPRAKRNTDR